MGIRNNSQSYIHMYVCILIYEWELVIKKKNTSDKQIFIYQVLVRIDVYMYGNTQSG